VKKGRGKKKKKPEFEMLAFLDEKIKRERKKKLLTALFCYAAFSFVN